MTRLSQFRAAYRRNTVWFAALLLVCLALGASLSLAQVGAPRDFDHLKTGYALTGMHVQASCESCHLSGLFKGTPRECVSCHAAGMRASRANVVMPQNHVPYYAVPAAATARCDTCHKGGTTTWANARFHNNVSVSTGCVTCHTLSPGGTYLEAVGKPATAVHATVTGQCETCHKSTVGWSSVNFAHSPANAVGTGTCDACHNGSAARGRPATHIPVTTAIAKCDSCHRSQASFASSMAMSHTVVATQQCKGCHNGIYVSQGPQGALAQPINHIPVVQLLSGATMDCNACHTSSATWTAKTMNHNNSLGNGAGWCKACHASGTSYLGNMQKNLVTHRSLTATDCSQSGCHRPQGIVGTAFRNWN